MNYFKLYTEKEISYPVGKDMKNTFIIVRNMANLLKNIYPKHSKLNLLVRGSSGTIISGILIGEMIEYDIHICHVKKDGEDSHASRYYPIDLSNPNIIIDDFICSGETVNAIFKEVNDGLKIDTLCVSGGFNIETLNFRPNNIISGK